MESGDPEARWAGCWGRVKVNQAFLYLVRGMLRKDSLRGSRSLESMTVLAWFLCIVF